MSEEPQFTPYEVEGVGTVLAHEGDSYTVRATNGSVYGYRAQNGVPAEANAAADIAYAIANPPAFPPPQAEIYAAQLEPGYLDETTGIRLKTIERAQAKFARMVTLVDLAVSLSALVPSSDVTVWDYDGEEQTLTVADFRSLMLRYGLFCKALFDDYAP